MKLPKVLDLGVFILALTGCSPEKQAVIPTDQTAEAAREIIDGLRQLEDPRSCKDLYDILKERADRLKAKIITCDKCSTEVRLTDSSIIKVIVTDVGDKVYYVVFRYDGPGKDESTKVGSLNGGFSVWTHCRGE